MIFLIATHFEGSSCSDGTHLFEWIQDDTNKDFLKGKKFCIFGLGNKNFETFNWAAKTYH